MRVVVIGTSGAGKSTFASRLAQLRRCAHVELDALYWGPGWEPVPPERFAAAVRDATTADAWVVDGNYTMIRDLLWSRATHIIWLDYGRRTVFTRVLVRTLRRITSGARLSHGNRETFRAAFLSRESILLWAVTSFARNRVKFTALRGADPHAHLQWIRLRKPAEADAFLDAQAQAQASAIA